MLKIKDNVDLKELEKYGFVYCKRNDYGKITNEIIYRNNKEDINIFVDDNNEYIPRILFMMNDISSYQESTCFMFSNTLYDLIKADLVEKVEE